MHKMVNMVWTVQTVYKNYIMCGIMSSFMWHGIYWYIGWNILLFESKPIECFLDLIDCDRGIISVKKWVGTYLERKYLV